MLILIIKKINDNLENYDFYLVNQLKYCLHFA